MNDKFRLSNIKTKDLGPVLNTNLGRFYPNLGSDPIEEGTVIPGIFQFSNKPGQYWNSITKFIMIEFNEYKNFKSQRETYITLQILRKKQETPFQAPLDMGEYEDKAVGVPRQFFFMVFKRFLCDLKDLYTKKQFKDLWTQQKILKDIVQQMVHSVIYFHKHFGFKAITFAHRDIKPQNFIVHKTDEGTWVVKLIDFGITKEIIQDTYQNQSSKTLTYCGTTRYFPPEILLDFQARQTGKIKNTIDLYRVDSWSLGVSVYEFMTSNPFFSDIQTLQKTKDDYGFKQVYLNAYQNYLSEVKSRFQDEDSPNNYSKQFKQLIKQLLTSTITFDAGVRARLSDLQFQSKFKDFYQLPDNFSNLNVDTRLQGKQSEEVREAIQERQKQYQRKQQEPKKMNKINIWEDDQMTNQKLIDHMLATFRSLSPSS